MNYAGRLRKSMTAPQGQAVKTKTVLVPSRGLIANENLGATLPGGASIMENWFPTAVGARLRGGINQHFVAGSASENITALFKYVNGSNKTLFAATATELFDATTGLDPFLFIDESGNQWVDEGGNVIGVSGANAVVGSLTGGDWISCQFTTSGGTYLRLVNGLDAPRVYDGATFATAPSITGTGLTASDLNYVWAYKQRLFFVQKNSLNAWYLPIDSIGGTATVFPMGGVFQLGGSLLFGASWSLNDGGGLSDNCVFVTTEGEVAVYSGDSPANWVLVGKYQIGRPMGKRAFVRSGGDLLIATEIGVVPLSQATQKTIENLTLDAMTYPIEEEWNKAVRRRSTADWFMEIYPARQMLVVGISPLSGVRNTMFVANVRTKAWCIYPNISSYCMLAYEGGLYIGTTLGRVRRMETTGSDDGLPYTGIMAPLFEDCGAPEAVKSANYIRATFKADSDPRPALSMLYDYSVATPPPPDAYPQFPASVWETGTWGSSKWGASRALNIYETEKSARGMGYVLAPCVQVTSAGESTPQIELSRLEIGYDLSGSLS